MTTLGTPRLPWSLLEVAGRDVQVRGGLGRGEAGAVRRCPGEEQHEPRGQREGAGAQTAGRRAAGRWSSPGSRASGWSRSPPPTAASVNATSTASSTTKTAADRRLKMPNSIAAANRLRVRAMAPAVTVMSASRETRIRCSMTAGGIERTFILVQANREVRIRRSMTAAPAGGPRAGPGVRAAPPWRARGSRSGR